MRQMEITCENDGRVRPAGRKLLVVGKVRISGHRIHLTSAVHAQFELYI